MTIVKTIPGDFNITNPSWPRYTLIRPGTIFTSDGFSATQAGPGQLTDATLGGVTYPWDINADGWVTDNGVLRHMAGGNLLMDLPFYEAHVELKFASNTVGDPWGFAMLRDGNNYLNGQLQFLIKPDAIETRIIEVGGASRLMKLDMHAISASDVIGFRYKNKVASVEVNGETISTSNIDVDPIGTHCGFTTLTGKVTNTEVDWLKITPL